MFDHRVDPPRCRCMFPAAATRWRASAIANTTDIVPPGPSPHYLLNLRYRRYGTIGYTAVSGSLAHCVTLRLYREICGFQCRRGPDMLGHASLVLVMSCARGSIETMGTSGDCLAPLRHRRSTVRHPLNYFAIRGPRRSLYSRTTSVIFVTRSQCTDHCLRTTPMLTIASSLPMS